MKRNLLLIGLLAIAAVPAFATMDVRESTTPEVLRNGNYSEECIRIIQLNKAYANAVPYNEPDPNHIKIGNKFFDTTSDIVRNIFIYLDPSYDDNKFFTRDIRMKTGFEDL